MSPEAEHPTVEVSDRQKVSVDETALVDLAQRTLAEEGVGGVELSVSLVSPDEMSSLHERFIGERRPTDVLSFTMDEEGLLGDVIICPEVARTQSQDLAAELRLLLVHGILHLLGYDHDKEEERRAMWDLQERYSGVRA
ncbi:MAG: rRNA maturation RNase YbeY [Actinomycetota bacterium]|nr:rRNA maturation RNase YbeY [Actinomycetota bacterium]